MNNRDMTGNLEILTKYIAVSPYFDHLETVTFVLKVCE